VIRLQHKGYPVDMEPAKGSTGSDEQAVRVVVSASDDHLERMDELAERLRQSGMQIDTLLKTLGALTGSVSRSKLAELGKLEGVSSVEPEREVSVPPPESPIQ
jgi:hypothetical protein